MSGEKKHKILYIFSSSLRRSTRGSAKPHLNCKKKRVGARGDSFTRSPCASHLGKVYATLRWKTLFDFSKSLRPPTHNCVMMIISIIFHFPSLPLSPARFHPPTPSSSSIHTASKEIELSRSIAKARASVPRSRKKKQGKVQDIIYTIFSIHWLVLCIDESRARAWVV